jgi:tetratricopeptide (TPR) repeat protein
MKKKPRNKRTAKTNLTWAPQAPRSILKDILFGLAFCLIFFGSVEIALRLTGIGGPDVSADPYAEFSSIRPLYEVKDGVASTAPAKTKFFNTVSFRAEKPAGTFRIFCFGGSTTYGHPYDGRTAFPRWMEALLTAADQSRKYEVINAGGISYASYRIIPLVQETLKYKPDLMVFYTGHNEFLESRTYPKLSKISRTAYFENLLDRLRFYNLLKTLLSGFSKKSSNPTAPKKVADSTAPTKPLAEEVNAILDHSAGLNLYHRDDEYSKAVVEHFEQNLRNIIALCKKASVPVIFVDPPSNLKDFSPFKSEHDAKLSAVEKVELDKQLGSVRAEAEKSPEQVLAKLNELLAKDPVYAESWFLKGRALSALGRFGEAKECFVKARDLDVCPLRCLSALTEKIHKITRSENVPLIAFSKAVDDLAATQGDKSGIPGADYFLDHVHPTIPMHQDCAEMIVDRMTQDGMVNNLRKLGAEEKRAVYDGITASLDKSVFALRHLNLAKTLRWAGKTEEARISVERVASEMPDNPEVHKMLGSYYIDDGMREKGLAEYELAMKLSDNDPPMVYSAATAFAKTGDKTKAMELYNYLIDKDAAPPEAYANSALIFLEDKKVDRALRLLEEGIAKHPAAEALYSPFGIAFAMKGDLNKAADWMQKATEAEPGDPNHFYNLAGIYALSGKESKALKCLEMSIQKGYSNAEKMKSDPVFERISSSQEFRKLVKSIETP